MKLSHLYAMLALTLPATVVAEETFPAIATEKPPLNDTIVNWNDDGMVIMEDGKGFASLYHNPDGIYFQVLVKDRRLQQQFLRRGMVVYADANGKKKKKYAIQFPSLQRPERSQGKQMAPPEGFNPGEQRMMRPPRGFNPADTAGMFGDIQQARPQDRRRHEHSKAEREKMLKFLVSQVATQPATFCEDDEESIMSHESVKIFTSGNNIVFSAFIPYEKIGGKLGKKGEIAIGITLKERESSDNDFPRGGIFGPPPGMMGGGMMPPPPGMGGSGRGLMLKEDKTFLEWIVFSTKNTNFTTAK